MSVADSEAVFKSRALQIGLSEAVVQKLIDAGIKTLGSFAFASSYVPGSPDDKPFTDMVRTALGRAAELGELAGLRRLFNESYSAASVEMKSMIEQSDDQPTRRLAPAERSERFQAQQKRLTGLNLSGQLEPGDSLVDTAVSIYESDRLRYISWEHCVSREHEILTSTKKDNSLTFDSSGNLKLHRKESVSPCDVTTDLQVKYCLARRGLALEQGNILAYEKHELWAESLFTSRLREVPPGYSKISFKQIQAADAKLFVVLGEMTRSGIKMTSKGRPCDEVFEKAMHSNQVQHLLQPLPITNPGKGSNPNRDRSRSPRDPPNPKGKGKGKKGKDKSNKWKPAVPRELLQMGCVGTTSTGKPLCYDFQLNRCTREVDRRQCSSGLHLCAVKNCQKDHAATACPNKKS